MIEDYIEFVTNLTKKLPTRKERIDHAFIGIIGEVGELADAWKKNWIYELPLNENNILEELGDLRFYIQMLFNEIPVELSAVYYDNEVPVDFLKCLLSISECAAELRRDSCMDLQKCFELLDNFFDLCRKFGLQENDVIEANMDKLNTRYPEKVYSNKQATERLDKQ